MVSNMKKLPLECGAKLWMGGIQCRHLCEEKGECFLSLGMTKLFSALTAAIFCSGGYVVEILAITSYPDILHGWKDALQTTESKLMK